MQILAGSLDVAVPGLLHAGYISAYPHTIDQGRPWASNDIRVMDVQAAVALKESATLAPAACRQAVVQPAAPSASLWPPASPGQAFGLAVAVVFFAYLFGLYFRRMSPRKWLRLAPWGLALAATGLVVLAADAASRVREYRLNNASPPWEGVAVREYQDPAAATDAILHGLIQNGLAGCPFRVTNLAAIQEEVAFPVPAEEYTAGMAYAQKTYGRDGWGREFQLEVLESEYRVTSAGPDGAFGTGDDVALSTPSNHVSNWEGRISSVYLRPDPEQPICFVHHIGDDLYRAVDAERGRRLTGGGLYDALEAPRIFGKPNEHYQPRAYLQLVEHKELFRAPDEKSPIYLVQFTRKNR